MERRKFIAGAGVALAATAGCMGSDDSAEGSFSESVEFAWYGVAGNELHVRVTAENTGDAEATYETPLTLFQEADFDMGTRVSEAETTQSGEFVVDGQPFDFSSDRSATVRQNYPAETQYTEEEVTTQVGGETEEEYVFGIDPSSSAAATEVWAALDDSPGNEFTPETVTSVSLDARPDRQLMRPASTSLDITLEEFEGFSVLEMTMTEAERELESIEERARVLESSRPDEHPDDHER